MQKRIILSFLISFILFQANAQQITPINGVYTPDHTIYAFIHAHLIVSPGEEYSDGTLIIRDGKVVSSGTGIEVPHNAVVFDLKGKYIYPSFIELRSNYGMPEVEKKKKPLKPQYVANNNGTLYWNDAIHPQVDYVNLFNANAKQSEKLRSLGFGTVLTHQYNGIMRGNAAIVSLGENRLGQVVLKPKGAAYYGFGRGNSTQLYPTSLMGSIALFRQTMYDADWYSNGNQFPVNYSLQAIADNKEIPQFFDARNYQAVLRAARLGEEFGRSMIATGGGDAYKHIEEIKASNIKLIVPLNFPKPYDVSDPLDAQYISLADLKHWELAPSNPAVVSQSGVEFALSASDNPKMFWKNLRKAIRYGLAPEDALKALTTTPAIMLQSENLGTLKSGMYANFFITAEDVFLTDAKVLENWTLGQRNIIKDATTIDPTGNYNLNFGGVLYQMDVVQTEKGYAVSTTMGGTKEKPQKGEISIENNLMTIQFQNGNHQHEGPVRLVGKTNYKGKIIDGKLQDAKGNWSDWTAIKQKAISLTPYGDSLKPILQTGKVFYPNMSYGDTAMPQQQNYFIKNVRVWTCDSTGNYKGYVMVSNGKIEAVGERASTPEGYIEIDGTGLHITPGIVDEHSHIAIKNGVNEAGQNNSAEVRIGDVINPDDINIYRQLAGGVTSAQLLHGSANPIGGQSQVIKLRWGSAPEQMKLGDIKFIKFALGENVKQSNSDWRYTSRFPQTRMGVEQVYIDAFTRAKAYSEQWEAFNGATKKELKNGLQSPRRDLELETLAEILKDQRYITCHSYIQSEITMLMNVADSMGFRINTFTHILEGYKVADKLKAHGANASTFSDWWAYKFEVNDAIPYNAAILSQQGVNTAINSDDAEMGRRLNQEAAKTVKYGGVSETEALKMITINPAKMLHIEDHVGSITVGKDADLVLWSGHPLSVYSHPLFTMIDGIIYYSQERDQHLQELIRKERQRIILAMMQAQKNGEKTQKVKHQEQHEYHCDSFDSETDF